MGDFTPVSYFATIYLFFGMSEVLTEYAENLKSYVSPCFIKSCPFKSMKVDGINLHEKTENAWKFAMACDGFGDVSEVRRG